MKFGNSNSQELVLPPNLLDGTSIAMARQRKQRDLPPQSIRLRAMRALFGYGEHGGQGRFADVLRIGQKRYANWENGSPLSRAGADIIHDRLGVGPEFLFYGAPDQKIIPRQVEFEELQEEIRERLRRGLPLDD